MTISRRLYLMTAGFLFALVSVGGFALWGNRILIQDMKSITHVQMPAVSNATLLDMMHDAIRANAFRTIIAGLQKNSEEMTAAREEFLEYTTKINEYLNQLGALPLGEDVRLLIEQARDKVKSYTASARGVSEAASAGRSEEALALLVPLGKSFEELEEDLEKLGDRIVASSEEAAKESEAHASWIQTWAIVFIVVASLVGFGFALWIIRSLDKTVRAIGGGLRAESEAVVTASEQLRSTATSLSGASQVQVAAIQQTAAAIEEINAMSKKTSANTDHLQEAARTSLSAVERGKVSVGKVLEAITAIDAGNSRVAEQMEEGNREVSQIVSVIAEIEAKTKVINDIVFQTKLLSFNASVEAARAGEAGKGFAVVADEVGNLAKMSGNAASEISGILQKSISQVQNIVRQNQKRVDDLLQDGQSRVESGRDAVGDCGTALDEIMTEASRVTSMVVEIARAIQEQEQGVGEINKAVTSLEKATNENASGAARTQATAREMLEQSLTVKRLTSELSALTGGEDSTSVAAPVDGPKFIQYEERKSA